MEVNEIRAHGLLCEMLVTLDEFDSDLEESKKNQYVAAINKVNDMIKELNRYRKDENTLDKLKERGDIPAFVLGQQFWEYSVIKHGVVPSTIVQILQKKDGTWKYRFCDRYGNCSDFTQDQYKDRYFNTEKEAEEHFAEMIAEHQRKVDARNSRER